MGSSIGIVLRDQSVELIEAAGGSRGAVRFLMLASAPMVEPVDEAQVIGAIKTVLGEGRKGARVGVCVPARDVLLRSFTMPLLPKSEWLTAIQFEARKYLPFKTQELMWNFHVVEQRASKQMSVVFVAIRTETFQRIQRCLSAGGARPAFLEASSFCLSRLVTSEPRQGAAASSSQFVGIVDVDPTTSTAEIVLAKDHVPYFAREVALKLARPAASGDVTTPASAPARDVTTSVDSRAELLLSELRLSLDFFTRENPQAVIQQLTVFGSQEIGGWISWLGEQLHFPVRLGVLPLEGGRPASSSAETHLSSAMAVGMALRGLSPKRAIKLDFLVHAQTTGAKKPNLLGVSWDPAILEKLQVKIDLHKLQQVVKPILVQLAIAFVTVLFLRAWGDQRIAASRQQLEQAVRAFPDVGWGLKTKSSEELLLVQQQVEDRLALIGAFQHQRISVTEKLDALAKLLPDGVWLEGLSYKLQADRANGEELHPFLVVRGACYVPGRSEFDVIQEVADHLKGDQKFFRGFEISQLGEVSTSTGGRNNQSYRTFKLNYQVERKL